MIYTIDKNAAATAITIRKHILYKVKLQGDILCTNNIIGTNNDSNGINNNAKMSIFNKSDFKNDIYNPVDNCL